MSRLLPRRFFALVPIPELCLTEIATGARPSCDTRPGLRSRPLGRRSGCSSAEPYPPPRPFFRRQSPTPPFRSHLLYRGNGNDPPALSIEPLPTCLRSTESAGTLQRLQRITHSSVRPNHTPRARQVGGGRFRRLDPGHGVTSSC